MRESTSRHLCLSLLVGLLAWAQCTPGHAQTVSAPGTANIFAAGLSRVPSFSGGGGTLPPSVDVSGFGIVSIRATGLTNCCSRTPDATPDGSVTFSGTNITGSGGISGIRAPKEMMLVGVFLGPGAPTSTAPPSLDFVSQGTDFTTLAPALQQMFVIGDGQTSSGVTQSFTVPAGATRLFLGIADAFAFSGSPGAYDDNTGSLTVTVTGGGAAALPPTPTSVPLGTPLTVPGTSNIFATGLTAVPRFDGGGGALPPSVDVTGIPTVTVIATGLTNCCSSTPDSPPDGTTGFAQTSINSSGGISGIRAPRAMFLVGVFLGPGAPGGTAPPSLDFVTMGTDFSSLAPAFQQVFVIGDGQTSRGVRHSFTVPAGATRLFLGFVDAFNFSGSPGFYDDNTGSLTVTVSGAAAVTPTPTPFPAPTPVPTPTPPPPSGGATLQITANSTSVRAGDRLVITLNTSPLPDAAVVDLYAAVRLPGGSVVFFTGDPFNPFSAGAATFRRALTVTRTSFETLNIVIPDSLPVGTYAFLAAFIRQGRPPSIVDVVGQLAQLDVTIGGGGALPPVAGGACSGTVLLFSPRATFATGPESPPSMTVFGRTTQTISFPSGGRAVLSSTPDGTGSFVVDNYISINGSNPCPNRGSCFSSIIDTTLVGRPIENALRPISPLDVTSLIPTGTSTVAFELVDTGVIAGNTTIYLVLSGPACPGTPTGGVGSISGSVRDSQTGAPLAGVSITVSGGGGSAVTASDGSFTITNIPAGTVTLTATLAGFITASRTVTVQANDTASANLAMSQQSSLGTGQVRVVLSWGPEPRDLDSHLTGPSSTGSSRFHVYYASRGSLTSDPKANLDRDNTQGGNNGPETITITEVRSGVYRYSVHDFTNRSSSTSSALSQSSAHVALFFGDRQVAEFDVPRNTPGTVWTVFELEGTQLRPINRLGFASDSSDITKFGLVAPGGEDPGVFRALPAK